MSEKDIFRFVKSIRVVESVQVVSPVPPPSVKPRIAGAHVKVISAWHIEQRNNKLPRTRTILFSRIFMSGTSHSNFQFLRDGTIYPIGPFSARILPGRPLIRDPRMNRLHAAASTNAPARRHAPDSPPSIPYSNTHLVTAVAICFSGNAKTTRGTSLYRCTPEREGKGHPYLDLLASDRPSGNWL